MIEKLPGTVIRSKIAGAEDAKRLIDNMFIMGGVVLSQVSAMTGLEPYMVQNWVARRFLTSPVRKQYSKDQFCRIAMINAMRGVLQIDKITALISYVNGMLDDDSDNILPDNLFYIYLIASVAEAEKHPRSEDGTEECVRIAVTDFKEPFEGAKERLITSLTAMVNAYYASEMLRYVDEAVEDILKNK